MHALMNENGTLARACTEDRCEWGGAVHSSLRLMTQAERRRFRIYDLVDDGGTPGLDGLQAGEHFEVDHAAGKVTRVQLWRQRTAEEKAEKTRAEAQRDLAASDLGAVRVLEDLVELLVAKGIVAKADLPAASQAKLDARKTLRAKLK
jgi:hypothetical protein